MRRTMRVAAIVACGLSLLPAIAGEMQGWRVGYKVLPPIGQGNLTIFPVIADRVFDTGRFLTLDEGIRSGQVIVAEMGQARGLVRPRPAQDGVWTERPYGLPVTGARVNELALVNNSDRPLILLAGEIVTGGKQDRVVGKDRIIPPESDPIALDVFCVEPGRWVEQTAAFKSFHSQMAQPSVRRR